MARAVREAPPKSPRSPGFNQPLWAVLMEIHLIRPSYVRGPAEGMTSARKKRLDYAKRKGEAEKVSFRLKHIRRQRGEVEDKDVSRGWGDQIV